MSRINRLNPQLANQIAAGEVIERPASIIKELLENSLDAGANKVDVFVEKGGSGLIRVVDNGSGIHKDDLELAVSRHATSKLSHIDDLRAIGSLGFRGEALASISSVSRMRLHSRQQDSDKAWSLYCEGIDYEKKQPIAHPVGTSIEVRDLFFNTPARRRFLKAEKTEYQHVETTFKRLALSRFDVAFQLHHQQKSIYQLSIAESELQQEKRVAKLLGKTFIDHALKVNFSATGMQLSGWIALEEFSRSSVDYQYFYLNGRIVRDKLLNHAVRQAYRDLLPAGRYPAYILYLDIEPENVDVNVHPTKHEVRLHNSRLVYDFIFSHLYKVLSDGDLTSDNDVSYAVAGNSPLQLQEKMPAYKHAPMNDAPVFLKTEQKHSMLNSHIHGEQKKNSEQDYSSVLGILHDRYALVTEPEGLRFFNLLDYFKKVISANSLSWDSKSLLLPATLTLKITQLEEKLASLATLGFETSMTGRDSFMIRKVPDILTANDVTDCVKAMVTHSDNAKDILIGYAAKSKLTRLNSTALAMQVKMIQDDKTLRQRYSWLLLSQDIAKHVTA